MVKSEIKNLWYMRRDKEIRGPFPAGMISRYILLGRIVETDELSNDQLEWKAVKDLPDLIPNELKVDLRDPDNQEKLRLARLREDERSKERRQHDNDSTDLADDIRFKRSGDDRRDAEPYETLKHREIRERLVDLARGVQQENYSFRALLLTAVLVSVIWIAISQPESQEVKINYCDSDPKPNVNWNHCHMEGAQLQNANLVGAKLHSTYLPGANIDFAILTDANLSYANLVNARMQLSKFNNAVLVGAQFRNANISGADFSNAKLSFAIMHGADLSNANFTNADLTHVDLGGANVTNADFSGAKLDKTIWIDNSVCAPQSVGECVKLTK